MLVNTALEKLGIADAGVIALLGYAVVFLGLALLMTVVILLGKSFSLREARNAAKAPVPTQEEAPAAAAPVAPGAAGELKLHNVEPKIAAMLMAIVADKMQKPINELRFISIKEVE